MAERGRPATWSIRPSLHAFDLPVDEVVAIAVEADTRCFATLWLGEHVIAPSSIASVHPGRSAQTSVVHSPVLGPGAHLADLWVVVGAVAAATKRIAIATGICLAPLRHPLVTAQAAATAWRLSGGRLVLGLGSGWLAEEFEALGVDFSTRGIHLDETIEVLRRAFRGGSFAFNGRLVSFADVRVTDERLEIPIVVGGNSEPALRRAATSDGWFSSGTPSLELARGLRDRITELRGADDDDFLFAIRVEAPTADAVDQAVAAGFDDLVFHVDQHVARRWGGWRSWLDEVEGALGNHLLDPVGSAAR